MERQFHDLRDRLAGKRPLAGGPRRVFQKPLDALVAIASPPAAPSPNAHADFGRHVERALSFTGQQHDPRAPDYVLRRIAITRQAAQPLPVFAGNLDAFDLAHAARIARRAGFGNP